MRPVKLRAGDFLVVGRDKGPGVDYVAKVNCVSECTASSRWTGRSSS